MISNFFFVVKKLILLKIKFWTVSYLLYLSIPIILILFSAIATLFIKQPSHSLFNINVIVLLPKILIIYESRFRLRFYQTKKKKAGKIRHFEIQLRHVHHFVPTFTFVSLHGKCSILTAEIIFSFNFLYKCVPSFILTEQLRILNFFPTCIFTFSGHFNMKTCIHPLGISIMICVTYISGLYKSWDMFVLLELHLAISFLYTQGAPLWNSRLFIYLTLRMLTS